MTQHDAAAPKSQGCIVPQATEAEVKMALYAMRGIFRALCWIETDNIDGISDEEVRNTRAELIFAGEQIAVGMLSRTG